MKMPLECTQCDRVNTFVTCENYIRSCINFTATLKPVGPPNPTRSIWDGTRGSENAGVFLSAWNNILYVSLEPLTHSTSMKRKSPSSNHDDNDAAFSTSTATAAAAASQPQQPPPVAAASSSSSSLPTSVTSAPPSDAFAASPQPPPPAKKKRTTQPVGNLTNAQKRMLCVKFSQVKMTQQELCLWAKDEFGLVNLPHQSTISKILSRAGELTSMTSKDLSARRKGLVNHPELDTALCNWVLYSRQNNVKLSGDMIKEKARQLAAKFGLESKMTFSNGWLGGFKKRHNIRLGGAANPNAGGTLTSALAGANPLANSMSSSVVGLGSVPMGIAPGDAPAFGSLDQFAVSATAGGAAALPNSVRELQEIAKMYHSSDIFTMSETGLYYALSPEKPAGRGARTAAVAAAKNERERVTIAFAVNADGSERLEPFFIGNTKLPKKILQGGLDGDEPIQFQYRDNKKAWMTPVLFQEWISTLDTKLRDDQRNILLVVAHAPSHIRIGLELTNVRLEMLPPSTTSQYQPFEAGIFAAFKRRYRRHHMHHALDRFEAGLQDDIYRIDLVQAMRWVRECWMTIPQSILKHYWETTEITHTVKPPSPQSYHAVEDLELRIENDICDTVSALQVGRPMTIEEFLNPGGENTALHCMGTDESDFIHSVGDNTTVSEENTMKLLAGSEAKLEREGSEAGGALGTATSTTRGLYTTPYGSRTTNEQLLASFKVLLPELDRLRFDEHAKNSIRVAFRKLKEKESEQSADVKQRHVTRKVMMMAGSMQSAPVVADLALAPASVLPPAAQQAGAAQTQAPVVGLLPPEPADVVEHTVI